MVVMAKNGSVFFFCHFVMNHLQSDLFKANLHIIVSFCPSKVKFFQIMDSSLSLADRPESYFLTADNLF